MLRAVTLDSRIVRPGDLFIALGGATTDGHAYVSSAAAAGAAAAMVTHVPPGAGDAFPCLIVEDTLRGFHALAADCRDRFTGRVLALTGSIGKTTVKEMLTGILRLHGATVSTQGSFNNITGVPLTVLKMCRGAAYAVVEMGMSAQGEIGELVPLVSPHIAAVLNVRPVHMMNFMDLRHVATAKAEILGGIVDGGFAILNADDPLVKAMKPLKSIQTVTFGRTRRSDVKIGRVVEETMEGQRFLLHHRNEALPIVLRAHGNHNRINACAATAMAITAGIPLDGIIQGLASFRPGMMRSQLWILADDSVLYEDCYNSSPAALTAATDAVLHLPRKGRRIVIMGDMLELGNEEDEFHRRAGRIMAEKDVQGLIGFGPLSRLSVEEFRALRPHDLSFSTTEIEKLVDILIAEHSPGRCSPGQGIQRDEDGANYGPNSGSLAAEERISSLTRIMDST